MSLHQQSHYTQVVTRFTFFTYIAFAVTTLICFHLSFASLAFGNDADYFKTDLNKEKDNSYRDDSDEEGYLNKEFTSVQIQKATILLAKWEKSRKKDSLYKKVGHLFPQETYDSSVEACQKGDDSCVKIFFYIGWMDAFLITLEDIRVYLHSEGKSVTETFIKELEKTKQSNPGNTDESNALAARICMKRILTKNVNQIVKNMMLNVIFYPIITNSPNFISYKEKILPDWNQKVLDDNAKKTTGKTGSNTLGEKEKIMLDAFSELADSVGPILREGLLGSYVSFFHLLDVVQLLKEEDIIKLIGSNEAIGCIRSSAKHQSMCIDNKFLGSLIVDFEHWINDEVSIIGDKFDKVLKRKKRTIREARKVILEEFWNRNTATNIAKLDN
ncbi:MAG: hypothetical protein JJW01_02805 [Alphaproteobacteria bacterium]|nr:hypothetical protein [Rickettsiales bacterium]